VDQWSRRPAAGDTLPGMAVRGSGGSVVAAVGVSAAVGAAQLGLGYGLDIIRFADAGGQFSPQVWVGSLTWATWIAANSTIIGAVVADRLGGRDRDDPARSPAVPTDRVTALLWRLVLATAAALGAATTVALVAVPARAAQLPDVASPQTVAAGYAALGVVASLLVAAGALAARAVASNILATAGWLWLLAVVAVTDRVLAGADSTRVPLAFWEGTAAGPWFRSVLLPDAGLAVAAALALGLLAALPAARRGDPPAGVVVSGAAGPLVVAITYLFTQPDLVGAGAVDLSRHVVVPYLVLAGLLGSLLAGAVPARSPDRSGPPADRPAPPAGAAAVPAPRAAPRPSVRAG
jgi:hypothetical protein